MSHAVLRADGSSYLGMGHIMRCVGFAAALRDKRVDSIFVVKSLGSQVTDIVQANGFAVNDIPADVSATDDARLTKECATKVGAKLIVTDICHRETESKPEQLKVYHELLAAHYFTVSLTNNKWIDLPAHIVVTPYVGALTTTASDDDANITLVGPSYFIFRPEFLAARKPRIINQEGRRVLVSVGGSDELHLTTKIVEALCSLPQLGLSIRVILGSAYNAQLRHEVTQLLGEFQGDCQLLENTADMAKEMCWADLAITGDGLTKYEAAVTGTPSIVLSRYDSEIALNQAFASVGSALYMGDGSLVDVEDLAETIQQVLENATLRASMSERGKSLVDGLGADRIIAHIPAEVLQ